MIETHYDPKADILQVSFAAADAVYDASEEVSPGVIFATDTKGRLMSIEIESVSRRIAGELPGRAAPAETAESPAG